MGGKGTVCYTRGLAGHPADNDRDIGFKNVLKNYPDIKVVPTADGVATGWDPAKTTQLTNDFIASGQYDKIQGIWTSGMDKQIVDAIKAANKPFVPIVDADIGGVRRPAPGSDRVPGPQGRRCHQHRRRRRRGRHPGAQAPQRRDGHRDPRPPSRTPSSSTRSLLDNLTDAGKAVLKSWVRSPGLDPQWPLGLQIDGLDHVRPQQAVVLQGRVAS